MLVGGGAGWVASLAGCGGGGRLTAAAGGAELLADAVAVAELAVAAVAVVAAALDVGAKADVALLPTVAVRVDVAVAVGERHASAGDAGRAWAVGVVDAAVGADTLAQLLASYLKDPLWQPPQRPLRRACTSDQVGGSGSLASASPASSSEKTP